MTSELASVDVSIETPVVGVDEAPKIAAMALNKVARKTRTKAARMILSQVAFPSRYVSPSEGRLHVYSFASERRLSVGIAARRRPTLLSRFLVGGTKRAIRVRVKPGRVVTLKRAFIMNLRSGNRGIVVRSKRPLRNTRRALPLKGSRGAYLLYGPSVYQAFIQQTKSRGVAREMKPDIIRMFKSEFYRLVSVRGVLKNV